MKIQRLQPCAFTYGKYGQIHLSWDTIKLTKNYIDALLKLNIVGYCDGKDIEVRPRPDDMAVMFEDDDGFQSWVHVPKDIWKAFENKNQ